MSESTPPPPNSEDNELVSGDPLGQPAMSAAKTNDMYGASPVPPGALQPQQALSSQQYVLADWWKRAIAFIVDAIILAIGGAVIIIVFMLVFSVGFFASSDVGIISLVIGMFVGWVAFALCGALYAPILMKFTNGQTVGKMLTGCRVVRANGQPIDFWWAVLREAVIKGILIHTLGNAIFIGGFPFATLLDGLWPLWDEENRALHDMLVDTRVVEA